MKITTHRSIIICFLLNALQVWYLCNEYFRFEVTTSVRISIPDDIEFPSFTLCLDLVDTIDWRKISVDLRKTLLEIGGTESYLEKDFDFHNVSFQKEIPEKMIESGKDPSVIPHNMANNLKGPQELFNVTLDFTKIMEFGDVYMNLDYDLKNMKDHVIVRETFVLDKQKCYSVHLPKVNRIVFNKLRASASRKKGVIDILLWILQTDLLPLCCEGLFYISSRDHVVTPVDANLVWKVGNETFAEYETYEETLMPAPYQTNCRNYKESGFSSRDHCRHQCLRSQLIRRFNHLTPNVKLYETDNTSLLMSDSMWEFWKSQETEIRDPKEFVEITFQDLCEKECVQPDCQSILHVINNIDYSHNPGSISGIHVRHSTNPVTVTVAQAAVPLISFLTSLFSTFGFWLGLSVMGSLSYVKRARDTTVSRCRLLIWNQDGKSRFTRFIPKRRMTQTERRPVQLFLGVHPRNNNEQNK